MVRIYPWLEESFGEPYEIHERVREIARFIEPLAGNKNLPADVRAGYVVDLMDAYQLYSDLNFLNTRWMRLMTYLPRGEVTKLFYRVVLRIFADCYVVVTISRGKWRTGFWPVA